MRKYIGDGDAGCLPGVLTHETKLESETAEKTVRRQWSEKKKLEKETKEKENKSDEKRRHEKEKQGKEKQGKQKQETKGNK